MRLCRIVNPSRPRQKRPPSVCAFKHTRRLDDASISSGCTTTGRTDHGSHGSHNTPRLENREGSIYFQWIQLKMEWNRGTQTVGGIEPCWFCCVGTEGARSLAIYTEFHAVSRHPAHTSSCLEAVVFAVAAVLLRNLSESEHGCHPLTPSITARAILEFYS